MVIFAGGKFREYVSKTFHVGGGDFQDTTPISFIKACGFYFRVIWVLFLCEGNFREEDRSGKITPTRKFPHSQ